MSTSSSLEEPECPTPNWLELPVEVTMMILGKLDPIEILEVVQRVCMTWRRACKDPSMWRSIDMFWNRLSEININEMMWRHVVDLSCGQLNHISIMFAASHRLLCYIFDRAPKLRSLRIGCSRILEGLDEIGTRLPQLEELYLSSDQVPKEVLESFGRCCPELKSLTYTYFSDEDAGDDEALVIAQTMPGLHHLSLFGNSMTNHGLQTILNQCPHLESLDLRECSKVDLGGDFGRSCVQRIKNLKLPRDFLSDDDDFDVEDYNIDYDNFNEYVHY